MRRAAKKDANQDEIVAALRDVGASVALTHQLGGGFPDVVVGYRDETFLLEIKDGDQPPSKQQLTRKEAEFHQSWRGQIAIVTSVEEALRVIGAIE